MKINQVSISEMDDIKLYQSIANVIKGTSNLNREDLVREFNSRNLSQMRIKFLKKKIKI